MELDRHILPRTGMSWDDVNSPLYFNHDDAVDLCQVLVPELLTSHSYHRWSRAMSLALKARNKIAYVDGSLPQPPETAPYDRSNWERNNALVLLWIWNSVSPEISECTLYAKTALQAWNDLKKIFSRPKNMSIYMLTKQIRNTKQGNAPVAVYFSRLKSLWDELSLFEDLIPDPSGCPLGNKCPALIDLINREEKNKIMQFFLGLNECYAPLRIQILNKQVLPGLGEVFDLILQEECKQELVESDLVLQFEGASVGTRNDFKGSNISSNNNNKPWNGGRNSDEHVMGCSHCGRDDHIVEKCHALFKFKSQRAGNSVTKQSQGRYANHGSSSRY